MSSFLLSTEVHRNSDADNYRTKKRTAIKSSVCELKLLKQKIEGRKCSKNVVCITWISQYCRISFLFENIWVVRRTFNQSLYTIQCSSQDCQAVRSLVEMFAERRNFRRTTRKAGTKPVHTTIF